MSCSLWRYEESCDHDVCVGDCDLCDKNLEGEDDDNSDTDTNDI